MIVAAAAAVVVVVVAARGGRVFGGDLKFGAKRIRDGLSEREEGLTEI